MRVWSGMIGSNRRLGGSEPEGVQVTEKRITHAEHLRPGDVWEAFGTRHEVLSATYNDDDATTHLVSRQVSPAGRIRHGNIPDNAEFLVVDHWD